jgi:uncharacterized membrane protein YphA (DoxX/SURF4 family)
MDTILWICQSFLAATFLYSGVMKSTQSEQWLVAHNQTGVEGLPAALIRFIGVSEIFGTAGIILPWLTRIYKVLTPLTACCFAVIMLLAASIHYRRKEIKSVMLNIFIFLVCLFVAWGRFKM